MKILISNDDGVFAPGIAALTAAFSAAGYEVFVCAPDSQRSAASHALSIHRAVTVKETTLAGAAKAYAIGGTPADCVKLGLTVLCPQAEAVVSGVNRGYNIGTDILYSGTVAAAMEGAICGRPALAVSQHHLREDYEEASELAVRVFARMMEHPPAPLSVINLNYPKLGTAKGIAAVPMGSLVYDEVYMPVACGDGTLAYALSGEINEERTQSEEYRKLGLGYASLTVLHYDMTDSGATAAWKSIAGEG